MKNNLASDQYIYYALNLYPSKIIDDLINKTSFRSKANINLSVWISFSGEGLTFLRDEVYDAIKAVFFNSEINKAIKDKNKVNWIISRDLVVDPGAIIFKSEEFSFTVFDFYGFLSDANIRMKKFNLAANLAFMESERFEYWFEILSVRCLNNSEMANMLDEFSKSKGAIKSRLMDCLTRCEGDYNILIPDQISYYEDLVGENDDCADILMYAANVLHLKFSSQFELQGVEAIKWMLPLCSHSMVTLEIPFSSLSSAEIFEVAKWARDSGDVISKISTVEGLLKYTKDRPELFILIREITDQIRSDSSNFTISGLCDLIILVEGQFFKKELFYLRKPYWRRLASIAHASILQRCVIEAGVDITGLGKSRCDGRTPLFLIQSAVDLRREPRWHASYLSSFNLKAELLGRIFMAAEANKAEMSAEAQEYFLSAHWLASDVKFPFSYMAGPLEGGLNSTIEMPAEIVEAIKVGLGTSVLQVTSFTALINSAYVFKLDLSHALLASDAIRKAGYQIRVNNKGEDLDSVLLGLAIVAAVTRCVPLADTLLSVIRTLLDREIIRFSIDHALSIGLTAAAANSDIQEWSNFLGNWITVLAFQEISAEEAGGIVDCVEQLCKVAPILWIACGKAIAALEAVRGRG